MCLCVYAPSMNKMITMITGCNAYIWTFEYRKNIRELNMLFWMRSGVKLYKIYEVNQVRFIHSLLAA